MKRKRIIKTTEGKIIGWISKQVFYTTIGSKHLPKLSNCIGIDADTLVNQIKSHCRTIKVSDTIENKKYTVSLKHFLRYSIQRQNPSELWVPIKHWTAQILEQSSIDSDAL